MNVCNNKIVKITNLLVSRVAKIVENGNYNLIGRVGYDCMVIYNTCTCTNYNPIIEIPISLFLSNIQRSRINILIKSL